MPSYTARIHAPEIPAGLEWVGHPGVALRALRVKVVVLDFWTYG